MKSILPAQAAGYPAGLDPADAELLGTPGLDEQLHRLAEQRPADPLQMRALRRATHQTLTAIRTAQAATATRAKTSTPACRGLDTELFYPVSKRDPRILDAKTVCWRCPIRVRCLADALDRGEAHGIWGGLTEWEREPLLRARHADTTEVAR